MEYGYNDESLKRHGVSRTDINEVLDVENPTKRNFDLALSLDEDPRTMFVGFNLAGRLLEVGVEFIGVNYAYLFHAQTVSPKYRKLYKEMIASE